MQAKDVRITEAERKAWIKDGILQEKILEKSGLFVNQFHPGDAARYWTAYEGGYQADIQALEALHIQEGHCLETVPVTFYLKNQDSISVTINVEVSSTDQEQETEEVQENKLPEPGETGDAGKQQTVSKESGKAASDRGKTDTRKAERVVLFWVYMAVLALLGFGCSLYSDFKVLRKYRQKRKKREEQSE